MYTNLKQVIKTTWDGDVTFEEAVKGFTEKQLQEMEEHLNAYKLYYRGIPFSEDLPLWIRVEKAAKLIQKMASKFEE